MLDQFHFPNLNQLDNQTEARLTYKPWRVTSLSTSLASVGWPVSLTLSNEHAGKYLGQSRYLRSIIWLKKDQLWFTIWSNGFPCRLFLAEIYVADPLWPWRVSESSGLVCFLELEDSSGVRRSFWYVACFGAENRLGNFRKTAILSEENALLFLVLSLKRGARVESFTLSTTMQWSEDAEEGESNV